MINKKKILLFCLFAGIAVASEKPDKREKRSASSLGNDGAATSEEPAAKKARTEASSASASSASLVPMETDGEAKSYHEKNSGAASSSASASATTDMDVDSQASTQSQPGSNSESAVNAHNNAEAKQTDEDVVRNAVKGANYVLPLLSPLIVLVNSYLPSEGFRCSHQDTFFGDSLAPITHEESKKTKLLVGNPWHRAVPHIAVHPVNEHIVEDSERMISSFLQGSDTTIIPFKRASGSLDIAVCDKDKTHVIPLEMLNKNATKKFRVTTLPGVFNGQLMSFADQHGAEKIVSVNNHKQLVLRDMKSQTETKIQQDRDNTVVTVIHGENPKIIVGTQSKLRVFDGTSEQHEADINFKDCDSKAQNHQHMLTTLLAPCIVGGKMKLVVGRRMNEDQSLGLLDLETQRFDHTFDLAKIKQCDAKTEHEVASGNRLARTTSGFVPVAAMHYFTDFHNQPCVALLAYDTSVGVWNATTNEYNEITAGKPVHNMEDGTITAGKDASGRALIAWTVKDDFNDEYNHAGAAIEVLPTKQLKVLLALAKVTEKS